MMTKSQQTRVVRSISHESIGLKISIMVRTSQFSSSLLIRPLRKIGIKAGTSVIDRSATPIRAKVLVNAKGWNIFPSRPESANTGRNDRIVIRTEKKIGRPTVRHALMTISVVSPVTRSRPKWRVKWCAAFSPITTAWSIRMPTLIEIPARLMMFDDIPKIRIIRKLNKIAIGSVTATTKALPTCPITSKMAIVQTISSSFTVPLTVSSALWISGVRS